MQSSTAMTGLLNREHLAAEIVRRLRSSEAEIRRTWNNPGATATRHFAVDDLLPDAIAHEIYAGFPDAAQGFSVRKSFREHKRTSSDLDKHARILAEVTYAIQSRRVVETIGALTGMAEIEPDPHLYAGGLSVMMRGDFLNPHIDNSHERTRTRYRRLNALYYVSPAWGLENGGNLELWDDRVTVPVVIGSHFNRLVVMETNKRSWHSVSPVVADARRCCISNYYFSERSPSGEDYYHVTSFTGRPGQKMRRAFAPLDNRARALARALGAFRASDKGYSGTLASDPIQQ